MPQTPYHGAVRRFAGHGDQVVASSVLGLGPHGVDGAAEQQEVAADQAHAVDIQVADGHVLAVPETVVTKHKWVVFLTL